MVERVLLGFSLIVLFCIFTGGILFKLHYLTAKESLPVMIAGFVGLGLWLVLYAARRDFLIGKHWPQNGC